MGKIWKRKSDLTSHLSQLDANDIQKYKFAGAEVVEYELSEREVAAMSLSDYLLEIKERKEKREAEWQRRREEYLRQERLKQYKQLKKEFESE